MRFTKGIGKLVGNTLGDHRKKTGRLTTRMPEAVGLAGLQQDDGPRYSLGTRPCSDDAVGSRRKFAGRFVERIGKLAGNAKGDRPEEDRRTCRKITRGCRSMREIRVACSSFRLVNRPGGG
ncbi:hypothetical protein BHE74_00028425 [Ensete ventricosum]|nr:hypothetical protein BHE74_00028425 [Ensete ventricosum]